MLAFSMRNVHAVTCEGHTDYVGTRRHHQTLSRLRALTVCRALQRFTVARIHPVGYGAARPLVIAGQQKSRVENRRVNVVVTR
jgi:outer membrane protein OmpA-like peptidoglycan-associated protein